MSIHYLLCLSHLSLCRLIAYYYMCRKTNYCINTHSSIKLSIPIGHSPNCKANPYSKGGGNPTPYELNPFTYYEHPGPLQSTLTVVHAVPSLSEIPKHAGLELVQILRKTEQRSKQNHFI
jgi:hypothetical protein